MLILGLLSVWRMVQCRWRISHNYVYSPPKACTVFSSCNRLLKKDFGMGDGERDWFPSERNKVHSTLLDMHASELCPRSLPFAPFDLLIPPPSTSFQASPSPSLQRREVINSVLLRYLLWLQLNVSLFSLKIKNKKAGIGTGLMRLLRGQDTCHQVWWVQFNPHGRRKVGYARLHSEPWTSVLENTASYRKSWHTSTAKWVGRAISLQTKETGF